MISGAVAVIGVTAVLVGIPLALTSISIAEDTNAQADAHEAGQEWADRVGWTLVEVEVEAGDLVVRFEGPIPVPRPMTSSASCASTASIRATSTSSSFRGRESTWRGRVVLHGSSRTT
jgi:hypothetical protein